jgi:hypothetical protein
MTIAASADGKRRMRPPTSHEASPEPSAMPTEKTVR